MRRMNACRVFWVFDVERRRLGNLEGKEGRMRMRMRWGLLWIFGDFDVGLL